MLSLLTAIFILMRIVFTNSLQIVCVVSSINVIAFCYVSISILSKIYSSNEVYLKKTMIPRETITQTLGQQRTVFTILSLICISIGILYIIYLARTVVNDIISIIAIFLSLMSDHIVKFFCMKHHKSI